MTTVHDPERKRALVLRLKRVEGQLRGIQKLIEEDADCEKVAQQLSASRRALDKTFFNVLACAIQSDPAAGTGKAATDKRLQQAAELLAKFG